MGWGISSGLIENGQDLANGYNGWDIIFIFSGVLATLYWCRCDASEKNFYLTKTLSFLILLMAVIGVPIYLIKSRGMTKGFIATIYFILIMLFMLIVSGTTSVIVSGLANK